MEWWTTSLVYHVNLIISPRLDQSTKLKLTKLDVDVNIQPKRKTT